MISTKFTGENTDLKRSVRARIVILSVLVLSVVFLCINIPEYLAVGKDPVKYDYGVFLGVNAGKKAMKEFRKYETIVLDVQNGFDRDDIQSLKERGHRVFSYINVGSVENYRDYYNDYLDITLGEYDNWPDERWVDVSSSKWQDFILNDLAEKIKDTGIDGFFVDNIDVYYQYHREPVYDGVENILKGLKEKGDVIINGGDTFVMEYLENGGAAEMILDGINQETVFTAVRDYESDEFGESSEEDRDYYLEYTGAVKKQGKEVYLLEYTNDERLKKVIRDRCRELGYKYYISKSLGLE
ncbi:MAG: endo alpha-1,4 polygalactosaminidase [Lachnospiraceae bacterium]|nr:endo alpha-1,4 polygalactosaminidase [Lachnospiraceae bacterium]